MNENGITIGEEKGKYKIFGLSDNLKDFHFYVLVKSKKLQEGFDNKEELMQEIRKMIEETGNRIIE